MVVIEHLPLDNSASTKHAISNIDSSQSIFKKSITTHNTQSHNGTNADKLTRSQSQALACVLEDSLSKLVVLGNCSNEVRALKVDILEMEKRRFSIHDEREMDPSLIEEVDVERLATVTNTVNKWDQDRQRIAEILQKIYLDMASKGSFLVLEEQLEAWREAERKEREIMDEQTFLQDNLKDLESQLAKDVHLNELSMRERDIEYKLMLDSIEDNELNNQITMRYVNKWVSARVGQLSLMHGIEESKLDDEIKRYRAKNEQEMRVSAEIQKCIEHGIVSYEDQIQQWIKKFQVDTVQLDDEIDALKESTDGLKAESQRLQDMLDSRNREIDAWVEFITKRNAEEELVRKVHRNATKIQAWWKGILTRRKFGPGALKKDKKAKGKKK